MKRIAGLRIQLYVTLLILSIYSGWDRGLLLWAGIGTVVSIWLQLASRFRKSLDIIIFWEFGFLWVIVSDAIWQWDDLAIEVSQVALASASRLAVATHCVVTITHAILSTLMPRHNHRPSETVPKPNSNRSLVTTFLVALFLIYALIVAQPLAQAFKDGRVGAASGSSNATSLLGPVTDGLSIAVGLSLPAMITFQVLRRSRTRVWRAIALSSPIFLTLLVIGTRFYLLFAAAGIVITVHFCRSKGLRRVQLASCAVVVVVSAMAMAIYRSEGLSQQSVSGLSAAVVAGNPVKSEGVLKVSAQLVDYYSYRPHRGGWSSLAVVAFWVPREAWSGKPQLLGYSFPRASGQNLSVGHTVSTGFYGDLFVDFGWGGAVVASSLIGMLLHWAGTWASRVIAVRHNPRIVIVGPLFGATFFAVRSINTALIAMSGVVLLGLLFVALVERNGPVVSPQVPSEHAGSGG